MASSRLLTKGQTTPLGAKEGGRVTGREALLLLAVLLLAAAIRIPSLWEPIGSDQAISAMIADALRDGQALYRDIWDHHTPLEFYIHALAQVVLGSSTLTVYLLDLLWTLANILALYGLARRFYGGSTALLGAALYALFSNSVAFNQDLVGTWTVRVKPEGFSVLPLACGIYAVQRAAKGVGSRSGAWWVLAGCAFGFATALKLPTGLFLIGAWLVLLIVVLDQPGRRLSAVVRNTLWLAGGALLVQLIYLIPTVMQGTLREFWLSVVSYNFGPYAGLGLSNTRFRIVSVLIAKETFVLWLLAAAALLWMFLRDRRTENWLIVGWGVLSGVILILQGRFFSYQYLSLLPPLCLLAAYGAVQIWRAAGRWRAQPASWILRTVLAVLMLASVARFVHTNADYYTRFAHYASGRMDSATYYAAFNTYPRHYSFPADRAAAEWVRERTGPDEPWGTLGGYGATPLYLANRPPASRYVFTYHLFREDIGDHPMIQSMRAELLADLQASQPPYLLLFRRLEDFERFGPLHEWLAANYQMEREFIHDRTLYHRISR